MNKKVTFNTKPTIHVMVMWRFAYKKARQGNWDFVVADRYRFIQRCFNVERIIGYIFQPMHRQAMMNYIQNMESPPF